MGKIEPIQELILLTGKKALITGSASGIGRAMANRFAEAGADLELLDVDIKNLRIVKKELAKYDQKVNIHKIDLSKKKELDSYWKELKGKEPDILVNNAGIYPFREFTEITESFYKKVVDVNLNAAFWLCHKMIKSRIKKGGVIINVSSIEAILPFEKGLIPYQVSKIGILGLTRGLAKDYGDKGFRINALVPGAIMTPGTKNVAKEINKFRFSLMD